MSLKTFSVLYHEGRVCYLTNSESEWKATVECYGVKKAFRFSYNGKHPIQIGEWVRFRGSTKIDSESKKGDEYYHNPHDDSPRKVWEFFEMIDGTEVQIIPTPEIFQCLKKTMTYIRRHVESWTANSGSIELKETISSLEAAIETLRPILQYQEKIEADRSIRIETIDITV
jgi:hypothetical protein